MYTLKAIMQLKYTLHYTDIVRHITDSIANSINNSTVDNRKSSGHDVLPLLISTATLPTCTSHSGVEKEQVVGVVAYAMQKRRLL
jgi:hypothetical protein